jgi:hypothetical protein
MCIGEREESSDRVLQMQEQVVGEDGKGQRVQVGEEGSLGVGGACKVRLMPARGPGPIKNGQRHQRHQRHAPPGRACRLQLHASNHHQIEARKSSFLQIESHILGVPRSLPVRPAVFGIPSAPSGRFPANPSHHTVPYLSRYHTEFGSIISVGIYSTTWPNY